MQLESAQLDLEQKVTVTRCIMLQSQHQDNTFACEQEVVLCKSYQSIMTKLLQLRDAVVPLKRPDHLGHQLIGVPINLQE